MHFKAGVMAAMAAAVSAQIPTDAAAASALAQLATALPESVLAVAMTNQAAFASEIASSIGAGNTPDWYQALPSDVKSVLVSLYPASTPAATTPVETAAPSSTAEVTEITYTSVTVITALPEPGAPSGTGSAIGLNSTAVSSVNVPTLSATATEGGDGSPSQSAFPGAASLPSAAMGAGLAGLLGFLGMLVL